MSLSPTDTTNLKNVLDSDYLLYSEFNPIKYQIGAGVSMAAYWLGLIALSASIFFSKNMFHFEALNPMEAVYVTSLIAFAITMVTLFSHTWDCCRRGTNYQTYQPSNGSAYIPSPQVYTNSIQQRLSPEEYAHAMKHVRPRNDVMSYLGVRP